MASPRPPSAIGAGTPAAGTDGPPSSVTATLATPSRGQATSTMNTPPRPEVVCLIAFEHSSDTHIMRVSLAGQPASSSPTNLRAAGTEADVPRKVRTQGLVGRADL